MALEFDEYEDWNDNSLVELSAAEKDAVSSTISGILGQNSYDDDGFEILATIRYDPSLSQQSAQQPQQSPKGNRGAAANGNARSGAIELSAFYLLRYHLMRLKFAVQYFEWDVDVRPKLVIRHLVSAVAQDPEACYKLRVLLSANGSLRVEAYTVPPRADLHSGLAAGPLPASAPASEFYKVYVDTEPTPIGPFTSLKTTRRGHYTASRDRILTPLGPDPDGNGVEVLLYNPQGEVMEGSITNIAFWRPIGGPGGANGWVVPPLVSGGLLGVCRQSLLAANEVSETEPIMIDDVHDGEEVLVMNAIIGVCRGRIVRPADDLPAE